MKQLLDRWQQFWFEPVPAHIYALLRIVFGVVGCLTLVGLVDLQTFWYLDGFVPIGDAGLGLKAFLFARGLGHLAGAALYVCTLTAFVSMTIGFFSSVSVPLALITSATQVAWNYLPLSGADAALEAVLFCLVWADCGSVWSADSWLARRRGESPPNPTYVIAPLRLIRFQVALTYLNAGLWKLLNPYWRDGTAVKYVVESNLYRRFPYELPSSFAPLIGLLTYGTLFWELTFAPFLLFRRTRRLALLAGVLIHLGMLFTIEIGPFHYVMLASYLAFLDPRFAPALPMRLQEKLWRRRVADNRVRVMGSS